MDTDTDTDSTDTDSTDSTDAAAVVKPGLLVVIKSSVRGGAEYDRREMSTDDVDPAGAEQVRAWATVQRVFDPDELAGAKAVRGRAVGWLWARVAQTPYGLVVTDDRVHAFDAALAKARAAVDAFNGGARHVRVTLRVLKTRLLLEEAAAAFEEAAEEAVEELDARDFKTAEDVEEIRKVADRAADFAAVLRGDLAERVLAKIREARAAATAAAKEVRGDAPAADRPAKSKKTPKVRAADAEALARLDSQVSAAAATAAALRSKADVALAHAAAQRQFVDAARTDKQRAAAEAALKRAVDAHAAAERKAAAAERKAAERESERDALAGKPSVA